MGVGKGWGCTGARAPWFLVIAGQSVGQFTAGVIFAIST